MIKWITARLGLTGLIASVALLVFVAVGIAGQMLISDPFRTSPLESGAGISLEHFLGVSQAGHDIFDRFAAGSLASLGYPLLVVAASIVGGCVIGLASAWLGGTVDAVVGSVLNVLFAFPGILLALVGQAVFGVNMVVVIIALTLSYVPYVARLVRGAALHETAMTYVRVLRVQGMGGWAACFRYIFPNLRPYIVAQAALSYGYAMLDMAGLSFLGLGVQPPAIDWGGLVSAGLSGFVTGDFIEAAVSGLAIVAVVLAVNVIAEAAVRDSEYSERVS